jgi:hypothetical protein
MIFPRDWFRVIVSGWLGGAPARAKLGLVLRRHLAGFYSAVDSGAPRSQDSAMLDLPDLARLSGQTE